MRPALKKWLCAATALLALGLGVARAQSPGQVIAGPYTATLPSSSLFSFSRSFKVPPPLAQPHLVRVELSAPNSLTALSVTLNGTQIGSQSDFAGGVTRVDKVVHLASSNTIAMRLAGVAGTRITVTLFTVVMPKPTALSPNPLALNAGAAGTLTAALSPVPTAPGTLSVTSTTPAIAAVPASVAFAAGQSAVAIAVSGIASGSTTITAAANGGQTSATVNVNAPPSASITAPANNAVFTSPASIPISAQASDSDGTIASVELYHGTTLITTLTATPYGFTWTNVAQGAYVLTAKATDNRGATTTSAAINITVNAAVAQLYFVHVDHLNTPRLVANAAGTTVWRWDQQEPFGVNAADENPSGLGAFDLPLRLPGQYFDKETSLHYNYYRDFDPSLGIYKQSDPIGLKGGLNTYAYGYGNPLAVIDPKGLEVEVGVRKFYPIGLPLVRHCFVRFSGDNSDTLGFTSSGVGPDPNPAGATYSPTIGPENDSCVREQMLKCREYAFFTNNCCDCIAYALDACGLSKVGPWPNFIPAGPFAQPPPPPMCGDQGCQFP